MMTEVSASNEPEIVSAGPDIASQIQDAAQTYIATAGADQQFRPVPMQNYSPSMNPQQSVSVPPPPPADISPYQGGRLSHDALHSNFQRMPDTGMASYIVPVSSYPQSNMHSPPPLSYQQQAPFSPRFPTGSYTTYTPDPGLPHDVSLGFSPPSGGLAGTPQSVNAPPAMQTPYTITSSSVMMGEGPSIPQVHSPDMNSGGLFTWGKGFMSKVVEKTKSSVETVITTLDPQMKNVIYSGGNLNVVVTSNKEVKVNPIKDAFIQYFGRVTVTGVDCPSNTAPQPLSFTSGFKGAEDRIQYVRSSGMLYGNEVIVSMEGFIVELLPDRWYEMNCLLLRDTARNLDLQTFSQPIPVLPEVIQYMHDMTAPDYPLRWSGLAVSVGEGVERVVPKVNRYNWQQCLVGVSRQETLCQAARVLIGQYRSKIDVS